MLSTKDWQDKIEYTNVNLFWLDKEITIAMINLYYAGYILKINM